MFNIKKKKKNNNKFQEKKIFLLFLFCLLIHVSCDRVSYTYYCSDHCTQNRAFGVLACIQSKYETTLVLTLGRFVAQASP